MPFISKRITIYPKPDCQGMLYVEACGQQTNSAIILNAGAGNQCITWPDQFCERLADLGYFVIRYDYRDCGLSSTISACSC